MNPSLTPVALVGPTASGKSAIAMKVAHELASRGVCVEIVSVDSALVYRGMDIGTAKPDQAERASVPHHGIDLIDPTERYSAAQFVSDARKAIGQIQSRGALPLLVGGTLLYLKALREGLDAMPAADSEIRAALDARAAAEGWPALHAELARVDPATAARLPPTDSQRIQRALEVWTLSGRPLSSWHRASGDERTSAPGAEPEGTAGRAANQPAPQAHQGLALHVVALEPVSRAWLHERIARRFDDMLAAGFLDEVRRLRARGDLHPGLPSIRCVGYRQAWEALEVFEAARPPGSVQPLEDSATALKDFREAGIAATRQLAKRQLTWLRSMPDRVVVAADGPEATASALKQVIDFMRQAPSAP
jgi:tRNA dimethylallyltransferase